MAFHGPIFSTSGGKEKLVIFAYHGRQPVSIDQYQAPNERLGADYLSDRPITAISSDIFSR